MHLTFIELPSFTRALLKIADDFFLIRLQNDLLRNPTKGDLIPSLQGLRKVRMPMQGRGRSRGARVIYLHLPQQRTVILFHIYTKSRSPNLTPDQEHRLRAAVEFIKREFRHEHQEH